MMWGFYRRHRLYSPGNKAHETPVDIFTEKSPRSGLIRNVQSFAFARQIDVLIVTDSQNKVDIARHQYIAILVFGEKSLLINDPPRERLRKD